MPCEGIWGFNWKGVALTGLIALTGILVLRLLIVEVACPIKLEELVCRNRSGEIYLVYVSYMAEEVPPDLYAEVKYDYPGKPLYIVVIDPDCKWAVTYSYIPGIHYDYEYTKKWVHIRGDVWAEAGEYKNKLDILFEKRNKP